MLRKTEPSEDRGPSIRMRSGKRFYYLDPRPEEVSIEDIAHSLANQTRYNGHAGFYSVAQHSVMCAEVAADLGYSSEVQFQALMHDAAEAYLGDVPAPLKGLLPDFRRIESIVEGIVGQAFDLPAVLDPKVREIDLRVLVTEAERFFGPLEEDPAGWPDVEPVKWRPTGVYRVWAPVGFERGACPAQRFLWRFDALWVETGRGRNDR